jgi:hypothetical protein
MGRRERSHHLQNKPNPFSVTYFFGNTLVQVSPPRSRLQYDDVYVRHIIARHMQRGVTASPNLLGPCIGMVAFQTTRLGSLVSQPPPQEGISAHDT